MCNVSRPLQMQKYKFLVFSKKGISLFKVEPLTVEEIKRVVLLKEDTSLVVAIKSTCNW